MSILLKNFRRFFIDSKKFKQYGAYAIGEITLIVIGILLALQINIKNEERKEGKIEKEILSEIANDLKITMIDLDEDLDFHLNRLHSANEILNALVNRLPLNDSIAYHFNSIFGDTRTYHKAAGYQNLLTNGVQIIKNDSLRILITDLYQLGFKRLDDSAERYQNTDELWPYRQKHTSILPAIDTTFIRNGIKVNIYKLTLKSYEHLLEDEEFKLELQRSVTQRLNKIRRSKAVKADITDILSLIQKTLNQ